MAKQPTPTKKPLSAPPHKYAGLYRDRCGALFIVPERPDFELYHADAMGYPTPPGSPLHRSETEFTAALGFGTFKPESIA